MTKLGDFMERSALSALDEVDAVLFVVPADSKKGPGDEFIIERLKKVHKPIYLVVNKIDLVNPNDLPDIVAQYEGTLDFKGIIPISALQGNNVNQLINDLVAQLPEGPQYYPSDQISDHPERFVIAEMIREKVFHLTRQEVPHSVAIDVTSVKRESEDTVHISANIVVERPGQKGIIIGKKGRCSSKLGKAPARTSNTSWAIMSTCSCGSKWCQAGATRLPCSRTTATAIPITNDELLKPGRTPVFLMN